MGFIDAIGLKEHLSPTRANGLVSMIKNIKMYALAFITKLRILFQPFNKYIYV
jgi:cysteine desulfuration protein SufE